jgi:hypothetical protein
MKLKPYQERHRKCLEGKNYEFKTESMYKNIRDFCVGTSEFENSYQSRTNFISYETSPVVYQVASTYLFNVSHAKQR